MAEETTTKKLSAAEAEAKRAEYRARLDDSIRTISHGKMLLMTPILSKDVEITELEYDFTELNSFDIMDALDSDTKNRGSDVLTNKQAFALFAIAVGCVDKEFDANDIKERMGADDCIIAVRVARAFFNLSAQRGALSISGV